MYEYLLNKNSTRKMYDVKQATEILLQYGLAHNEKKTRDLIAKGKLQAQSKGHPMDRRSGFEISEKALYDLVVKEIPIMKEIFNKLVESKQPKAPVKKQSAKVDKQLHSAAAETK